MNFFRGLCKFLLGVVVLCALPFLIEVLLNSYELNRNPWTKLGAIVTDGGAVKEGLNRRIFNEIRFRSTGMRIYFTAANLDEKAADSIHADIGGNLRVVKEGKDFLSYNFRLEPHLKKNVGGLDTLESVGALGSIDIAQKYDVECVVSPASPQDKAAAEQLYQHEFGVGEAVELVFDFEGALPNESGLMFTYSKCPSSLLHGTYLDRVAKKLKSSKL